MATRNPKAESNQGNSNDDQSIPGMDLKYTAKKAMAPVDASEVQKNLDKTKKELEKLKAMLVKKYSFIQAIGILPPQAVKAFADDELGENVPEEEFKKLQKKIHLYVIIPEEKFKEINKLKKEMVELVDKSKQDVWLYLKTPIDVWEACMDSKFDIVNFIGMSYPLFDTGILAGLRVATIHKNLVLQKFDKYVVSYVIGGSLVRGNVTKTSDVDAFIIINDTDVKRMPRLELKERLRGMIYQYIAEATALAGVGKEMLNVQVWLLTEFWESVKDAHPVMFTFIRDGVPLYDKGTFLPWKTLLRMGRLKPTPEAIEMFMSTAEKTGNLVDRRLLDAMIDLYYKVLNPSQALIMLAGNAPPTHKETPKLMEDIFVNKEKMLKKQDVAVLAKLVKLFRDYEHNPKMTIKGYEIDKLVKDSDIYIKRLEELRKQIEKKSNERTVEQMNKDVFELLEAVLGKNTQSMLVNGFESLVKQGKFTQQHLRILKDVVAAKAGMKKEALNLQKVDELRRNSTVLINELIEYSQRADLMALEKSRMRLKFKTHDGREGVAELLHMNDASFLFIGNQIKKITNKVEDSNMTEVSKHVEQQRTQKTLNVPSNVFEFVKKQLGDFEIVL